MIGAVLYEYKALDKARTSVPFLMTLNQLYV